MEPNAWKGFFRSYVLGQWYCYIFNMILKNNNQDLNWYWNALWLSSHSFWKLRNCIQASKWKKSWVGVQVFACDVAVESDHVVIRNSRSQFKTTSSSRKSEGDFTPCECRYVTTIVNTAWGFSSPVSSHDHENGARTLARSYLRSCELTWLSPSDSRTYGRGNDFSKPISCLRWCLAIPGNREPKSLHFNTRLNAQKPSPKRKKCP